MCRDNDFFAGVSRNGANRLLRLREIRDREVATYQHWRSGQQKEEETMNIYVGNLSREITEEDLRQAFGGFGQVASVTILKDKYTGEPKGFGFVEMAAKAEGQAAIAGLNGKDLKGRALRVDEARAQSERRGGGGGRGRRGGGGGPRR